MEDANGRSTFEIIKREPPPTLQEIADDFYERTGLTKEEVAAYITEVEQRLREMHQAVISAAVAAIQESMPALVDVLEKFTRAVEEELAVLDIEPRSRRRKRNRERARRIEQTYRAEIRRCERERHYRRIYKPP